MKNNSLILEIISLIICPLMLILYFIILQIKDVNVGVLILFYSLVIISGKYSFFIFFLFNNNKKKYLLICIYLIFLIVLIFMPKSLWLPADGCGLEGCYTRVETFKIFEMPCFFYANALIIYTIYNMVLSFITVKEIKKGN